MWLSMNNGDRGKIELTAKGVFAEHDDKGEARLEFVVERFRRSASAEGGRPARSTVFHVNDKYSHSFISAERWEQMSHEPWFDPTQPHFASFRTEGPRRDGRTNGQILGRKVWLTLRPSWSGDLLSHVIEAIVSDQLPEDLCVLKLSHLRKRGLLVSDERRTAFFWVEDQYKVLAWPVEALRPRGTLGLDNERRAVVLPLQIPE
jgi:hypothetical protein